MNANWTDEMKQLASSLFGRGISAAEVALELHTKLGVVVSRNSVMGMMFRMGIKSPNKRIGHQKAAIRAIKVAIMKVKVSKPLRDRPAPVALDVPTESKITIVELEQHHCRAVLDGRIGGMPTYCGQPRREDSSWCEGHHALHYTSKYHGAPTQRRSMMSAPTLRNRRPSKGN